MATWTEPPATASGADGVHGRLRDGIARGRHPAGHRFVEAAIAEELGVSRTPVREALQRLQSEGLVERTRRGACVVSLTPSEVDEVYDVRAAIEGLVARRCAERQRDGHVPPSAIEALGADADAFDAAAVGGDLGAMVAANVALHERIADLSAHRLAVGVLRGVWARMAISSASNLSATTWLRTVRVQHRALVDAIAQGAPAEAERLAVAHVNAAAEIYRSALIDQETS